MWKKRHEDEIPPRNEGEFHRSAENMQGAIAKTLGLFLLLSLA